MSYDHKFLIALGFSLFSEILVLLILNYALKLKKKPTDIVFAGFIATFSSIIYLWYILPNYLSGVQYLLIGETLVFVYEFLIYKKILGVKWWQAVLLSLIANIVSYGLGWFVI